MHSINLKRSGHIVCIVNCRHKRDENVENTNKDIKVLSNKIDLDKSDLSKENQNNHMLREK